MTILEKNIFNKNNKKKYIHIKNHNIYVAIKAEHLHGFYKIYCS